MPAVLSLFCSFSSGFFSHNNQLTPPTVRKIPTHTRMLGLSPKKITAAKEVITGPKAPIKAVKRGPNCMSVLKKNVSPSVIPSKPLAARKRKERGSNGWTPANRTGIAKNNTPSAPRHKFIPKGEIEGPILENNTVPSAHAAAEAKEAQTPKINGLSIKLLYFKIKGTVI